MAEGNGQNGSARWAGVVVTVVLAALLAPAALAAEGPAAALKKTCDKGAAADCRALAGLHLRGEGVARDPDKAKGLFKKACDLNDAPSCLELAGLLRPAGAKEIPRVTALLEKACLGGQAEGCAQPVSYTHLTLPTNREV